MSPQTKGTPHDDAREMAMETAGERCIAETGMCSQQQFPEIVQDINSHVSEIILYSL